MWILSSHGKNNTLTRLAASLVKWVVLASRRCLLDNLSVCILALFNILEVYCDKIIPIAPALLVEKSESVHEFMSCYPHSSTARPDGYSLLSIRWFTPYAWPTPEDQIKGSVQGVWFCGRVMGTVQSEVSWQFCLFVLQSFIKKSDTRASTRRKKKPRQDKLEQERNRGWGRKKVEEVRRNVIQKQKER